MCVHVGVGVGVGVGVIYPRPDHALDPSSQASPSLIEQDSLVDLWVQAGLSHVHHRTPSVPLAQEREREGERWREGRGTGKAN